MITPCPEEGRGVFGTSLIIEKKRGKVILLQVELLNLQ
jgi:hypothetical protein